VIFRLHDHNKEKDEIPEESIDSLVNEFEEKSKHPAQLLKGNFTIVNSILFIPYTFHRREF